MRAPKPSSVEDRVPTTPDPCDGTNFPARFTREAAKAVNCHEDRIPNTPDPCDCGHFPKKDDSDMRVINKATVTRTAFPDRPDPCDGWPTATLWQLPLSDNCHEDSGPTINKAIIVTRHMGRRHPTTNQRNVKMLN